MTRHAQLKARAVEQHVCIYSGCETPPHGDSFMCERHGDDARRRKRVSARGRRYWKARQMSIGGIQ